MRGNENFIRGELVRDASYDSENRTRAGCTPTGCASPPSAARFSYWPPFVKVVFLFFYFLFSFFTKYIFDSEIYKNIPRPPRYRAAGTWPPGRGIYEKKFAEKIARRSLGAGRPAAGRPAPQAARQLGGRLYFLQFSSFREIISHMCPFCNFLQK